MSADLVVALDIGSTYSGYAWQYRDTFNTNPGSVETKFWKHGLSKTSTAILFSDFESKTVDSIGFVAERRYGEQGGINAEWRLFRNFKVLLYGENFREDVIIEDDRQVEHTKLKCVMTLFIKHLKNDFLARFSKVESQPKIRWVVTVPAIWNDTARHVMRQCAEDSGIASDDLIIALEPEAAAIHCMHLSREEKKAFDNLGQPGDLFLLADLGGGTTDICVQKVTENGRLEQIYVPDGERAGGQDINNAFVLACKYNFVGSTWFDAWNSLDEQEKISANQLFEEHFETKKVEIGHSTEMKDEWISVPLPHSLAKLCDEGKLRLIKGCKNFDLKNGKFRFDPKFVRKELFNETINIIFNKLREILSADEVSAVRKVVLVGGLSESPIVKRELERLLQENFPARRIQVFTPLSPMYAVVKGAVIFGHDPDIFQTRVSRYTYGIKMVKPFDEHVHPEAKRKTISGKEYCCDIFDIHIERGQKVTLQERRHSKQYVPVDKESTKLHVPIFISFNKQPKYTDEANSKKLATILVELPDKNHQIMEVTMIYGGNEIRVEAKDRATGKQYTTEIDFQTIEQFKESNSSYRCTLS